MRAAGWSLLLLLWITGSAAADSTVLAGRVTDLMGKPVSGARIHVLADTERRTAETDSNGRYRVELDGDAVYSVVVAAGTEHTYRHGKIKRGSHETFDIQVESVDGEVIRIIDTKPPTVKPKLKTDALTAPPYSEEAVERDAWAKAWLVLDIDETGKVARVKLIKRPGFDLDEIAVKEALKLHFAPALDDRGKPMRTQLLWGMEWPSHGWLSYHGGNALRLPQQSYSIDPFLSNKGPFGDGMMPSLRSYAHVPCAGSGPLNLDQLYPVYRDCSLPDLRRASVLPWYDGETPMLSRAEETALVAATDPTLVQPGPSTEVRPHSHLPAIVSSSVTAALIVGTVVSYLQYDKYWSRVQRRADLESAGGPPADLETLRSEKALFKTWQKRAFAFGVTSIVSGLATSFFWFAYQPKSSFSVQPEGDGASVSFMRAF